MLKNYSQKATASVPKPDPMLDPQTYRVLGKAQFFKIYEECHREARGYPLFETDDIDCYSEAFVVARRTVLFLVEISEADA